LNKKQLFDRKFWLESLLAQTSENPDEPIRQKLFRFRLPKDEPLLINNIIINII